MAWEYKSMFTKSRERSTAKKYLNRNLAAGHRTPNEHYLERAGLRGRKKWLCCGFIFLLFLFALGHLTVTCYILWVLQFDVSGFQYFTFQESATVWPEGAILGDISIAAPHGITGYRGAPLSLTATQDTEITLEVSSQLETQPLLSLDQSEANINVGESLSVRSRDSSRQLLYADSSQLQVNTLSLMGGLKTTSLTTSTVSGVSRVTSRQGLTIMGLGGVTARGGMVNITARGGTTLTGQSMTINGDIALPGLRRPSPAENYHLCAHNNGTLFLVPHNPRRCLGPT